MAQNTKPLVRRQAHDITLAQQIHCACPVSLVFHDLSGANMPTIAPSPRLDPPKKEQERSGWRICIPPATAAMAQEGTQQSAVLITRSSDPAKQIICSNRTYVPAPLVLDFLLPHETGGTCCPSLCSWWTSSTEESQGFLSLTCWTQEKKPGFWKAHTGQERKEITVLSQVTLGQAAPCEAVTLCDGAGRVSSGQTLAGRLGSWAAAWYTACRLS